MAPPTDAPADAEGPDLSDDLLFLRYCEGQDGTSAQLIYRDHATGIALQVGDADWLLDWVGWSPDGGRVVGSVREGDRQQIQTVDLDGSEPWRASVPSDRQYRASQPRWSPLRNEVVFVVDEGDPSIPTALYLVTDQQPGAAEKLTNPASSSDGRVSDSLPCWSADGVLVAYRHMTEVADELQVIDRDGIGGRTLMTGTDTAGCSWSPTGPSVAVADNTRLSGNVTLIDAATGHQANIASTDEAKWTPSWSPDGSSVAYSAGSAGSQHLFRWSSGTGQVDQLTEGPGDQLAPTWSPDGRWIAYVCQQPNEPRHICVVDVRTRESWQVTYGENNDTFPAWRPRSLTAESLESPTLAMGPDPDRAP